MKVLIAVVYLSTAALLGWYSPSLYRHVTPAACSVNSIVIYNEKDARIVTAARWLSEPGGVHHRYSAQVTRRVNGQPDATFHAERTVVTSEHFHARYLSFSTQNAFRLSGPETSGAWPGAYIDPIAEKGFTASVYLFRAGGRWLQGFSDRPRTLCDPAG